MKAADAAETKTEALRKAARAVEQISSTLQSKADTIRQLSQQVIKCLKMPPLASCERLPVSRCEICVLIMVQGVHKALIQAEQKEMGSR